MILNEFLIKSILSNLNSNGFNIVKYKPIEIVFADVSMIFFKVKVKNLSLYFTVYVNSPRDKSFIDTIVDKIEHQISYFYKTKDNIVLFKEFVLNQVQIKLNLEHGNLLAFYESDLQDFCDNLASSYNNPIDFMNDIENIDLKPLLDLGFNYLLKD